MAPNGEVPKSWGVEREAIGQVGSFTILSELGRGGMGVVYRARDLKLDRDVALKRPLDEKLGDPNFLHRFMTEARTASRLMHPNITTVFEVFEEDDTPWLVMELIEGESLRSMLRDRVPLPFEDVLHHAEGLADALREAHAAGVLHRDVNPNNILIGRDGRARLSDFGLARVWDLTGSTPSEATTKVATLDGAGTRGYMAPEQVLGKSADPRSDLFSLGVVLYEMCTGRPAFARGSSDHWIEALLHQEPEPISQLNRDIPIEFQNIIRKAVAKRPFQRYQNASEMLQDIRALNRRMQSETTRSWSGVGRPDTRRRNRIVVAAAAVVVAAVAGVLVWHAVTSGPPTLAGRHRKLTSSPGWEGQPAISPDGTMVAFTSNASGNRDIWLVHATGEEPAQRTKHPASDSDPAWMPDGGALVFVSDRNGTPSVWRMPVLGGSPVKMLADAEQPAISPDGKWIAFSTPSRGGLRRIAVAPLDDLADVRVLTGDDDGVWDHLAPAWSPDSRTLCYNDQRDLWLVSVDGGAATQLTADGAADFEPAWTSDGRRIVFGSVRDDNTALWTIPAKGGEPTRLTAGTSGEQSPSLNRRGDWLAYCTSDASPNVVIYRPADGERLVLRSSAQETFPVLTPDARAVVFQSNRTGGSDLWLQPLDGFAFAGPPRRLTRHPGTVALPDVSPDGRWVAYHRVLEGQRDIWLVPIDGGPPLQFTDDPGIDAEPAFSPDGTRLAWESDRSGVENVWVAEVRDGRRVGDPVQVTHGDSADLFPSWSPDGRRLAYVEVLPHASEVLVVDLGSDAPPVAVTDGAGARQVYWDASGESLLVSGTWGGETYSVRRVSLADRSVTPLDPELELGASGLDSGWFRVWKGGELLAFDTLEQRGDIWLAELEGARR